MTDEERAITLQVDLATRACATRMHPAARSVCAACLAAALRAAREEERAACAKIAEDAAWSDYHTSKDTHGVAAKIRARGETK